MKNYYIEAYFNKKWNIIRTEKAYKVALKYVMEVSPVKYPVRIVRVVRTVVFGESK